MRETYRPRAAYRHWRTISTRWHDNDVYGHVNNVVYYGWFDTVVNSWLIENGLLDPTGEGPIGLVIETGCRYASPLSFPEDVEIGLVVSKLGRTSVTYHIGVFRPGADAASAEGHFTHVYVERGQRRPTPIPIGVRAILETKLRLMSPD